MIYLIPFALLVVGIYISIGVGYSALWLAERGLYWAADNQEKIALFAAKVRAFAGLK